MKTEQEIRQMLANAEKRLKLHAAEATRYRQSYPDFIPLPNYITEEITRAATAIQTLEEILK